MIPKAHILTAATEEDLRPTTIEKDYSLGWILYGISRHSEAARWVFKGGTCLKKCFFNTYRFSEDLDFTIPRNRPYTHAAILDVLRGVTQWVESESGILFPEDGLTLEEYENPRGSISFQGRASFAGPLQMARKTLQRVKFDLTQDEVIADTPARRAVNHPYKDEIVSSPAVLCYSVNEILAEKSRARDVYDVVHLSRAFRDAINPAIALDVVKAKFEYKGLPEPTINAILQRIDTRTLQANWEQQLQHQLPILPDVQGFVDGLHEALAWWLAPDIAVQEPTPIPSLSKGEATVPREPFPYGSVKGRARTKARSRTGPFFGRITYAARNRLCLGVRYDGVVRLVEPYSLRYPRTGNTLLYVWERERGGTHSDKIEAYDLTAIEALDVTAQPFAARYLVEL